MALEAIDPAHPDPALLARAAELLRRGQLVAFPTETVYGLGANALDSVAVERIFQAKGRPSYNPVIVHVADEAAARRLTTAWPEAARRLAARWWPGPLTLVLPKTADVPATVTAGLETVALRVPAHPVAQALLRAAQLPIAAPSANRSGQVSPTEASHVARGLGSRVGMILDGGPCTIGIESTVVDLSGDRPVLLRPGSISLEELATEIGPVVRAGHAVPATAARPSPGMLDRHYAPNAALRLFPSTEDPLALPGVREALAAGKVVTALLRTTAARLPGSLTLPADSAGYARQLYGALHRLDAAGVDLILVEQVPETAEWAGVRDRLARAAHSSP